MPKTHSFNTAEDRWSQEEDYRLCDLIADDCYTFQQIANIMGRSKNSVTSRFTKIRRGYGAQAS